MRIAIAGGTGTVGTHVVEVARERGHDVIVLSRSTGVDLMTGAGLDAALEGVAVVVDVASTFTQSAATSVDFFTTVTRTLLSAEKRAGVPHHVALSIVGIDGSRYGYYAGKQAQERELSAGSVPFTVLRATQFHEFVTQGQIRVGPFALVPTMRTQPVAAREVAERLVDLAEGDARGRVADLAGPREESLPDMARRYLRATGGRARVVALSLPGAGFREMRSGALLPGPDAVRAGQTFEEWIAARD